MPSLEELKALQRKLYGLPVGAPVRYATITHEVSAVFTLTRPECRPMRRIFFSGDRPRRWMDVYEVSPHPYTDRPNMALVLTDSATETPPSFTRPPHYTVWRDQEFRLHETGVYTCFRCEGTAPTSLRFMRYRFATRNTTVGSSSLVFEQIGDEPWTASLQATIPHDGVTIL